MKLEGYDLIKNKSKIYFNGSIWDSENCGKFEIIGKLNILDTQGKYYYFLCKFSDETMVKAKMGNIINGSVKNPNHPNVFNVGYIGTGKYNYKYNKKEYRLWYNMFVRCFCSSIIRNLNSYKLCYINVRWHNFQNFCEDIVNLKGYREWKNDTNNINKYQLDKDIKVKGNKIYSKDTCMFVPYQENLCIKNRRARITGLTYIGNRIKDGYVEEFTNQSDFARKYNLRQSSIGGCMNGKYKTHAGWTFKVKDCIK